jgi:hypothetical protein
LLSAENPALRTWTVDHEGFGWLSTRRAKGEQCALDGVRVDLR